MSSELSCDLVHSFIVSTEIKVLLRFLLLTGDDGLSLFGKPQLERVSNSCQSHVHCVSEKKHSIELFAITSSTVNRF